MPVPANVACSCANNSVGRFHRAGQSPCQMVTADKKARFWVVGISRTGSFFKGHDNRPYAYIYASFNTVAGAQKRFVKPIPGPIDWTDLVWDNDELRERFGGVSYQLVRNPNVN